MKTTRFCLAISKEGQAMEHIIKMLEYGIPRLKELRQKELKEKGQSNTRTRGGS